LQRFRVVAVVIAAAFTLVLASQLVASPQQQQGQQQTQAGCRHNPSQCTPTPTPTSTPTPTPTPTSTATPTPTPVPGGFGGSLPARLPESTGTVVNVSTYAEFNTALSTAANGSIVRCGAGVTIAGAIITRVASASAPITVENCRYVSGNGSQYPLRLSGRYIRIRNSELTDPTGPSSAIVYFLGLDCELDRVDIHGNGTATEVSGIFTSSSSARLQVWYSQIHDLGVLDNNDHGAYIEGTGHAIIGSLFYAMPKGFGIQIYPVAHDILIAGSTIARNTWKAGFVIGGSDVTNVQIRNTIVAYNVTDAIQTYGTGTGSVSNSQLWAPSTVSGPWTMTETSVTRSDPLLDSSYRPAAPVIGDPAYTPPLYRDGTTRAAAVIGSERPA